MASAAQSGTAGEWSALVQLDTDERVALMVNEYEELARLQPYARRERLEEHVRSAYRLEESDLCTLTESRIRAWLSMDAEAAAVVAADFEKVLAAADVSTALQRAVVVQSLAAQLDERELERLRALVPGARIPPRTKPRRTGSVAVRRRPWWAFWWR